MLWRETWRDSDGLVGIAHELGQIGRDQEGLQTGILAELCVNMPGRGGHQPRGRGQSHPGNRGGISVGTGNNSDRYPPNQTGGHPPQGDRRNKTHGTHRKQTATRDSKVLSPIDGILPKTRDLV